MRLTCAPARGVWGQLPRKIVKFRSFAGAFWSGFDTFELRVQLTSAQTRALTARVRVA